MQRINVSREFRMRMLAKKLKPQMPTTPVGGEPMKHEDVVNGMKKYDVWKIHSNTEIPYEWYFSDIIYRLNNKENFTFIRLCDGDYHNIFFNRSPDGKVDIDSIRKAAERELYILDLKNDNLIKGIEDNLIVGMQFGTQYDREFVEPLKKYTKVIEDGYSAALFSWAYATDNIEKLFYSLRNSGNPIILVGPNYLEDIDRFPIANHIHTPEDDSWLYQDSIDSQLNRVISEYLNEEKNPIILYACSVSAKISSANFYEKYGKFITQLDMGSNLNPYADKPIRGWQIREKSKNAVDFFKFYDINENLGSKLDYRDFKVSSFCSDISELSKEFLRELKDDSIAVEIGVHGGFSLLKTFDIIDGKNIKLFGIDCWDDIEKIGINGLPNSFFTGDSLEKFLDLHRYNKKNLDIILEAYDLKKQITLIKGFSYDPKIIEKFKNASISYLYIDGDHSYSGCYNDLKNWYPKMKKGGLIIGDDGNLNTIKEAVKDFCRIENIQYTENDNKFYFVK